MGMAEVAALAIGFGNWVAICDLDSRGTVSILTLLPLTAVQRAGGRRGNGAFHGPTRNSAGRDSCHPPLTGLRK